MQADAFDDPAPENLSRTLILAPLRKDSDYVAELLSKHSLEAIVCLDADHLEECLSNAPGLFITTHEALTEPVLDKVAAYLKAQPDWSELPIIVLLDKNSRPANVHQVLSERWPRSRLVFYHRPVATLELLSGIQSLLLARLRQGEVRDHLDREIELRRELNHRVKNILASVLSILHLTRRSAETVDQMASDLEGRLTALAEVHSAVFRSGGETIEFGQIVARTLLPYRSDGGTSRVDASGPPLTIGRDAGTALALSLHELVTNALKYGALSVSDGRAQLRWTVSGDPPQFGLQWIESGGPTVRQPQRTGYGTRYLRAALSSLLGNPPVIEYHPQGLHFSASGPLSRLRP